MTTETVSGTHTITALFDRRSEAMQAVSELVSAGIPRTAVRVSPDADVAATTTSYDTNRDEKGFWASLSNLFMPDEDRHTYAEAMNRGSIMVSASVDAAHSERAEDILEKHGTVNVEEREATWRKEGWAGYSAPATNGAVAATTTGTSAALGAVGTTGTVGTTAAANGSGARDMANGDQVIDEVAEELRVGKRQVGSGRVKVRSYVVETPVSEQVSLHTESVHVERRPVDRAMGVSEDAFKERTIEAVATSEEAVVAKEARVTGEVLVRKQAGERTETVTDTVRSTKVEIQDDGKVAAVPVEKI